MTVTQRCIAAIKKEYPKHTKQAYSLAKRTEETGVTLCRRAQEIDYAVRAQETRRKDAHKLQYSLRVRVTENRYKLVKQLIEQEGRFPTVQSWLDWWVYVWVKQKTASSSEEQETVQIK